MEGYNIEFYSEELSPIVFEGFRNMGSLRYSVQKILTLNDNNLRIEIRKKLILGEFKDTTFHYNC